MVICHKILRLVMKAGIGLGQIRLAPPKRGTKNQNSGDLFAISCDLTKSLAIYLSGHYGVNDDKTVCGREW
ncbi:MAG: hypothetical protein Ct9H300mP19_03770 [Dehalococcoidia bacterium]|nr:MAG: hypothetical protein CM1200mP39_13860 [Dehalococcoidia bacterium]GIT58429.1 MAG: hypothetical protein Ct9H300mP19_03770 [Dehalococcoidia bacterium]